MCGLLVLRRLFGELIARFSSWLVGWRSVGWLLGCLVLVGLLVALLGWFVAWLRMKANATAAAEAAEAKATEALGVWRWVGLGLGAGAEGNAASRAWKWWKGGVDGFSSMVLFLFFKYMYICMYVCMYVMYVCMYVCMYVM